MNNFQQQTAPESSYDPSFFSQLYAVEDRHFWFRTRNRIISELVAQITGRLKPGYKVLEVGCGNGNVLRFLESVCTDANVAGMDLFVDGLMIAQKRVKCQLIQADMHEPPFSEAFDLVGLFDVLEHLPDDVQVLRDLYAMLKPGGALLLTVPAHMSLWSYFDEVHHFRRYQLDDLRAKLNQVGFQIDYSSYFMATLFPLVWSGRRLSAVIGRKSSNQAERTEQLTAREFNISPLINGLLTRILYLEAGFTIRRKQLPTGTSVLCLAYKGEKVE